MASERHDISFSRGQDATFRIVVTEGEDTVNLDSHVVHFSMKTSISASTLSISKSSAVSTEVSVLTPQATTTNTGRADIFLDAADTASLTPGVYVYDVWVVDGSGDATAVIEASKFRLERSVTEL